MTKARIARPRRSPKHASALERLEPAEAQAVLARLLAAHPDLQAEAEQTARSLLGGVTFEDVADDVEQGLRSLDIEDLGSRAGRHRGFYTTPTEAAWELLQEAVNPFLADMKRQMEIGLEAEALETCKGLVLGLYRIRGMKGDEFLGWAPDFPAEAAADAVRVLAGREKTKQTRETRHAKSLFEREFVDKHVPEWGDLIARALE